MWSLYWLSFVYNNIKNFEWRNKRYYKNNKSLKESGLLIKRVSKTSKNKAKEQKGVFLGMLLGTLGASLLENLLAGKGTIWWRHN